MLEPSVYVVAGFGKAGSNDSESPMPDVTGGGIDLSSAEISAVVAYLQDLGGAEVTVAIPTGAAVEDSTETVAANGPDLGAIGVSRDSDYLRRAILDPNAEVAEGYPPNLMPATYGAQFYAQELELLVAYMQASVGGSGESDEGAKPETSADAAGGEALMIRHGCGACHKFGGQVGAIGPDLSDIGAIRDGDFLRRAILEPNADISDGYMPNLMPPIYAAQLSTEELDLIVVYLAGLK